MVCSRHDPKPAVVGYTLDQRAQIYISKWREKVRCTKCGTFGVYSKGRNRGGRLRILWFTRTGMTEEFSAELKEYRTAIGLDKYDEQANP